MRTLLLVLFTGIFLGSAWQLFSTQEEYQESQNSYSVLDQYISIPDPTTEVIVDTTSATIPTEPDAEDNTVWPVVDFEALQEINPDIVGWIYIEGTEISYPIVQGEDNSYYLKHLFDGTYNSSGCVFLDAASSDDFSDFNNIIYGHNMKNGTMFHALMNYKEQQFYDEHPVALLLTPSQNYKIMLFSGYVASNSDNAWQTDFTASSYVQWLSEITGESCLEAEVSPTEDDIILTFSTCSYEFSNARFVLHGIIAW